MQASGVLPVPPLARATTALLCVDLQPCYYTPPLGLPAALPGAAPAQGEPLIIKHGFDGFHGTELHARLQERGVDTLVIIGVITRACVLNTLLSAFNHGFTSKLWTPMADTIVLFLPP